MHALFFRTFGNFFDWRQNRWLVWRESRRQRSKWLARAGAEGRAPLAALEDSQTVRRSRAKAVAGWRSGDGIGHDGLALTLETLPCGATATVRGLDLAEDEADRLRRVGIREGSRIARLGGSDPLLVRVENARLALSRRLAPRVRVERGGATPPTGDQKTR